MRWILVLAFVLQGCASAPRGDASGAPGEAIDEDRVAQRAGSGQINGRVVDTATGTAVSLASVAVSVVGKDEAIAEAITDVAGTYALKNIEPGTYSVSVRHGALSSAAIGVVVLADKVTELNHSLSSFRPADGSDRETKSEASGKTGTLAGRILDGARGEPFGGVTVEISAPHLSESLLSIADSEGHFTVGGLSPGTYVVSIYYSLQGKGLVEIRRSGIVVEAGVATELLLELDTEVR